MLHWQVGVVAAALKMLCCAEIIKCLYVNYNAEL